MVQAHAHELLNQKDAVNDDSGDVFVSQPLYDATERLLSALERLERSFKRAARQQPPSTEQAEQLLFFEKENESLRTERETLNTTINQLRTEYTGLHRAASTIYNKLEDSIKRLTKIIEE